MPCSCQVKKATAIQFKDPVKGLVSTVNQKAIIQKPVQEAIQQNTLTVISAQKLLQGLDTAATTRPDQLCLNCVRKHLSLAYIFISQQQPGYVPLTIGQLLCAAAHLQQTYPNYALKIADKATLLLRVLNRDSMKYPIYLLLKDFIQQPEKDLEQYIPQEIQTEQEKDILVLCLVYSLLFVQLSYQETNKTWATAHLSHLAYMRFRYYSSIQLQQQYRPLWKMIQSMTPYDQNYLRARAYLQALITEKWQKYKQSQQVLFK